MDEQPKARVWPVFLTLFVSLTLMLMAGVAIGVVAIVISAMRHQKLDPQALLSVPWVLLLSITASQAVVLLSVRVMPGLTRDLGEGDWATRVGWLPARFSAWRAALAWVGCLCAGQVGSFLVAPLQRGTDALMRFDEVARTAPPVIFVLLLIAGGVAPGLAEELTFRGLAQSRFIARWGPVAGIALSAFLFGLYHLDLRQGLAAMGMGVWLGWFSWRDGGVVNNAVAHALNNIAAFTLSRFVAPAPEFDRSPIVAGSALVILLVCTVLTARFVDRPQDAVKSAT